MIGVTVDGVIIFIGHCNILMFSVMVFAALVVMSSNIGCFSASGLTSSQASSHLAPTSPTLVNAILRLSQWELPLLHSHDMDLAECSAFSGSSVVAAIA